MSSDVGTVLHAYGVAATPLRVALPATGVDRAPVGVVESGGLTALVSPLDAARFGEHAWRDHAEDPDWLTSFATQHQAVLGAVAASSDVLPFRIPGMYADEPSLVRMLAEEQDLLSRGLEAVSGHVEWGVQVFLSGRVISKTIERPGSGRDYLRRRSERSVAREREADHRRARVLDAYGRLADGSRHSVANPPQDPALSRREEPMLLNSAHLVPRNGEKPFFAVLAEVQDVLRDDGMVVEVSGPWPPYNFVDLGAEELRS